MKKKEIYITYEENRTGGVPDSNEAYCNYSDTHIDIRWKKAHIKHPGDYQVETVDIDFDIKDINHIYIVVVRYKSGSSFGNSYGEWELIGAYKNYEDAQEVLDKINYDEEHKHNEDYKKEYEKDFRSWDGYFERFESAEIEVLHIL